MGKLDKSLLLPDEDFIAQTRKITVAAGKSVHATIRANLEDFKDEWEASIEALGTCCYKGIVPPDALTRWCILDVALRGEVWFNLFFVDEVSVEYHAKKGQWHRDCLAWAFGDSDSLPEGAELDPADRRGIEVVNAPALSLTPSTDKEPS